MLFPRATTEQNACTASALLGARDHGSRLAVVEAAAAAAAARSELLRQRHRANRDAGSHTGRSCAAISLLIAGERPRG